CTTVKPDTLRAPGTRRAGLAPRADLQVAGVAAVAVALATLSLASADAFQCGEWPAGVPDDPDVDHRHRHRLRFAWWAVALGVDRAPPHRLHGFPAEIAEAQVVVNVPLRERTGEERRDIRVALSQRQHEHRRLELGCAVSRVVHKRFGIHRVEN